VTYSEVKKKIKYWRDYGQYGGDTEKDMMRHIIRTEARAEAAESALAAVPIGAMKLLVWMLDDGPWDDVALAEVQRWIDAREEAQP
jgi:hypothetical protein